MFNPKLIENFDEVDAHNIKMFDEFNIVNPDELRHVCVVCGKMTCIEHSMSNQGHNLVCNDCGTSDEGYRVLEGVVEWIYNWDGHENKE